MEYVSHPVDRSGRFGGKVFAYFLIGVLLAVIGDVPDRWGWYFHLARIALYLALGATLLFPVSKGAAFLLIVSVVCTDIVQATSAAQEVGAIQSASLWQGGFGLLRPSWLIMMYMALQIIRFGRISQDRYVLWALVWFLTVPVITGLAYGGFETNVKSVEVPVDVKQVILLLAGVLLYRGLLKKDPSLIDGFAAAFVGSVLARHGVDFAYWFLGIGPQLAEINRVSLDSTKATVIFQILLGLYLMVAHRRVFSGGALAIAGMILVIAYATRMLWVLAIVGVVVLLLMLQVRKWVLTLPLVGLVGYITFALLVATSPENLKMVNMRMGGAFGGAAPPPPPEETAPKTPEAPSPSTAETILTAFAGALPSTEENVPRPLAPPAPTPAPITGGNILSRLDPARYAEMFNSIGANVKRFALLWGSGYGSYYTETVMPFPLDMIDAFPNYSIETGRFFFCHDFFFRTLFKYGIIGLVITCALWFVPGWRCFLLYRTPSRRFLNLCVVILVAFLPAAIAGLTWSGKGFVINGFLIAFYMTAAELARRPAPVSSPPEQAAPNASETRGQEAGGQEKPACP